MTYGPYQQTSVSYSVSFYDGDQNMGENTYSVSVQLHGVAPGEQDAAFQQLLDYMADAPFLTHRSQASRLEGGFSEVTPT